MGTDLVQFKGAEVLVDALVAKLRNGLEDRINEINAEYNDTIQILVPQDYYTSGLSSIPRAPAVIVADGPMSPDPNLESPPGFISDTSLLVYVLEQDVDRQKLGRRLQRLTRAVIECALWDDPEKQLVAVNGPKKDLVCAYRLMISGTQPGRVFDPETDDSYRGFYLAAFTAKQVED
jgi:hypothetical protein